MAGRASDRKNKMPGNVDCCCGEPKLRIKPPATPYINGNKAIKEKKNSRFFDNNFCVYVLVIMDVAHVRHDQA